MMAENAHQRRRLIAVAAATCISLACGTNVLYLAPRSILSANNTEVCILSMGAPVCTEAAALFDTGERHRDHGKHGNVCNWNTRGIVR